jgi:hypothetical protein
MVEKLKVLRGRDGALDVKTFSNNPEEHLPTWVCRGLKTTKLPAI